MDNDALTELEQLFIRHHKSKDLPPSGKSTVAEDFALWKAQFPSGARIANKVIEHVRMENTNFRGVNFSGVTFIGCDLDGADFHKCVLEEVSFTGPGTMKRVDFSCAVLTRCTLDKRDLSEAIFDEAELSWCELVGANLRSATFDRAKLEWSDLRNVDVDSRTSFKDLAAVDQVFIDRYTLACLGSNTGGLTVGNRMKMVIVDDALELRGQFGGIWTLLHLAAIVIFLFPYAWFVLRHWAVASFGIQHEETNTIPLWQALAGFVYTGGGNWKSQPHEWDLATWSFGSFVVFSAYNVARMALLWKTKNLETQEEIRELPVVFSLQEHAWWKVMAYTVELGFWFALFATCVNTWHFLTMRIAVAD
jgi:hypothetical protein